MSKRKTFNSGDWERADSALWALDPDAPDAVIAEAIAECAVSGETAPYYLTIFHDIRPSTARHIAKMERDLAAFGRTYRHDDPVGPCPVRFDWQRKNVVGIKESDRGVAKAWAMEATLLGYCVFHKWNWNAGIGFGKGNILDVRERIRTYQERDRKAAEWNRKQSLGIEERTET